MVAASAGVPGGPLDRGRDLVGLVALEDSLTLGKGEPWAAPYAYDFVDAKSVVVDGGGLFHIFSPSDIVGWGTFAGEPSTGVGASLQSLGRLGRDEASSISCVAGRLGDGELLRGLVATVGGNSALEGVEHFFFFLCLLLEEGLWEEELVD